MFTFDVEGQEFGLKPMNCPGHCLMFRSRARSYKELPLRFADFGVLHRNELSGALTGLTRVRRFQQDDAHIFCMVSQIKDEVLGVLELIKSVYAIFGMSFSLCLSTRPKTKIGDDALWDRAEALMGEALEAFGEPWKLNPGDGAFYGPKIDVRVYDALERPHQCATVQLDFNLPERFDLLYTTNKGAREADAEEEDAGSAEARERPVMVHRAILGSVERMIAILTEHYGGKWPLWLSPRQLVVVPVTKEQFAYSEKLRAHLHGVRRRAGRNPPPSQWPRSPVPTRVRGLTQAGFHVDVDESLNTLKKMIAMAQVSQYNYILVVGRDEVEAGTVNVRTRAGTTLGQIPLEDFVTQLEREKATYGAEVVVAAQARSGAPAS